MMDHLNVFNSYKNKSNNHEDELTRNFLILLKNIPIVQVMFFEMVRKEMPAINVESMVTGDLSVEEVHTQLSNSNVLFSTEVVEGRKLLSIIISDDKLESEAQVNNVDRQARYDGVVLCNPSWLFIIENKPFRENIWIDQLNPNIQDNVKIIKKPCCLSWREVIAGLNSIIKKRMVSGLERILVEDFIEYVDAEYSWINPYTAFDVCKGSKYLLDKRCISILSSCDLVVDSKVYYHKGWSHYILSGKNTIKQIFLNANEVHHNGWSIVLWLYAGDIMSAAKEAYDKLDIDKLFELHNQGFVISKNFHLAYQATNLLYFEGTLSLKDYLLYWKQEYRKLQQVKRDEFKACFNKLEKDQFITSKDRSKIQDNIINKKYDHINICPGFLMRYSWASTDAIELDRANKFENDFKDRVTSAFSVVGGI